MRVFVTGATGFIGSAVVRELLGAGHSVIGLARTEAAAKMLVAAGAQAWRGSLDDLAGLRKAAASSDGVIHLAFMHGLSKASLRARLRILFGGRPGGIVSRFMTVTTQADRDAIDALGAALEGSGRPLVAAFGTMGLAPSGRMTEEDAPDPHSPGAARAVTEELVQAWAARGVRASIVRLAPSVHGEGGYRPGPAVDRHRAQETRVRLCGRWAQSVVGGAPARCRVAVPVGVGKGRGRRPVSWRRRRRDTFRTIAEVIGQKLGVSVAGLKPKEAAGHFSWLGGFVAVDNPASSRLTQEKLGWVPQGQGLFVDLERSGYFGG